MHNHNAIISVFDEYVAAVRKVLDTYMQRYHTAYPSGRTPRSAHDFLNKNNDGYKAEISAIGTHYIGVGAAADKSLYYRIFKQNQLVLNQLLNTIMNDIIGIKQST